MLEFPSHAIFEPENGQLRVPRITSWRLTGGRADQQPLQMLFTLRSTARSWASTAALPVAGDPLADAAPDPVPDPVEPLELAVPALLVPGGAAPTLP